MNRYSRRVWYLRYYLWLRWKPWFAAWAVAVIVRWFLSGARIPDEERLWFSGWRAYIQHIWMMGRSLASAKMGDVYTLSEVIAEVKGKTP
jgi:hypothetical protein